jgi:hypothetical protein
MDCRRRWGVAKVVSNSSLGGIIGGSYGRDRCCCNVEGPVGQATLADLASIGFCDFIDQIQVKNSALGRKACRGTMEKKMNPRNDGSEDESKE